MAGQLRGEHERGHRKDSATETQNRLTGGSVYVYRATDSIACLHDSSDRNLSSSVETYPLNQSQISIFTEEVLKLVREKGQVTAWDLYNVATEIYKPGRTDFPALIPQNGAMAELLLSVCPQGGNTGCSADKLNNMLLMKATVILENKMQARENLTAIC